MVTARDDVFLAHPYGGSPARPCPPLPAGWRPCTNDDHTARAHARSGALAGIPLYHFVDELLPTGLHRFFAYETAHGPQLSAYRFEGTLGAASTVDVGDGELNAAGGQYVQGLAHLAFDQAAAEADFEESIQLSRAAVTKANAVDGGNPAVGGAFDDVMSFSTAGTQNNAAGAFNRAQGAVKQAKADVAAGTATPPGPPNLPPPPNPGPNPSPNPGGGKTTPQVTPKADGQCTTWLPTTQNADGTPATDAVALANQINDGQGPVPWKDQSQYVTSLSGVRWAFTMNFDNGEQHVVAWRCTSGPGANPNPSASAPTSSLATIALAALGLVAVGTGAVLVTRRKKTA